MGRVIVWIVKSQLQYAFAVPFFKRFFAVLREAPRRHRSRLMEALTDRGRYIHYQRRTAWPLLLSFGLVCIYTLWTGVEALFWGHSTVTRLVGGLLIILSLILVGAGWLLKRAGSKQGLDREEARLVTGYARFMISIMGRAKYLPEASTHQVNQSTITFEAQKDQARQHRKV